MSFTKFGKFLATISLNIHFCTIFFFFPSDCLMKHVRPSGIIPLVLGKKNEYSFFSFFSHFYSAHYFQLFVCSIWINFYFSIFRFMDSYLLLCLPNEFLIILFSSRFSIWFSFCLFLYSDSLYFISREHTLNCCTVFIIIKAAYIFLRCFPHLSVSVWWLSLPWWIKDFQVLHMPVCSIFLIITEDSALLKS